MTAPVPSIPNLRDLGGLPTARGRRLAPGRLFRSSHLGTLSEDDRPRLQALGLRTVVDLRGQTERERLPPPALDAALAQLHLPIEPRALTGVQRLEALGQLDEAAVDEILRGAYRVMVGERLGVFRDFVGHVLQADRLPLLFHCTAGKDRTGFAAAAVLWALEVPQALIEQDYLLSNERWPLSGRGDEAWVTLSRVRVEYLHEAMQAIEDGWGSMDAFLERGLGLDDRARQRLADALLD